MYDFCFTPFYSATLSLAGLYAFVVHGSLNSLGAGVGSAILLSVFAYISMQYYMKKKAVCRPTVALSLAVAAGLAYVMYMRYSSTGAKVPLILSNISAVMCAFYLWSLIFGPVPKLMPKQKAL